MKNDFHDGFLGGGAAGVFIGMIVFRILLSFYPMTSDAKQTAVKAGYAEYYLDAQHERAWRWKACPTCQPEKSAPDKP